MMERKIVWTMEPATIPIQRPFALKCAMKPNTTPIGTPTR
jgi:hypothetical protein